MTTENKKIAIFGATGYIGLILANRLINSSVELKLFVRNRQRVKHLKNYPNVQRCDLELTTQNVESIAKELQDIDIIYYLIHSMDSEHINSFEQNDLKLARVVSQAAALANVKQIIYLGGLGINSDIHPLSTHLQNRHLVADRLRESGISVTEIRAGIIIGAGSASFEIIRALGQKLPFIPKLTYNDGLCNPIDVDDVVSYLIKAYQEREYEGKVIEIGMSKAYRYDEMISIFSKEILNRELKTYNIGFISKVLSKKIVARIVSYLSAIPYALSQPLIDGVDSLAVKEKYDVKYIDDSIKPIGLVESMKKASMDEKSGRVESFWSIPISLQVLAKDKEKFIYVGPKKNPSADDKQYAHVNLLSEVRERYIDIEDIDKIFDEVKKIGGEHGYWSPHWMWQIRAFIDRIVGGPGLEVGRKTDRKSIRIGERFDFWIVSAYLDSPERKVMTLKGRIKSPGDSWLQFALFEEDEGWKFTVRAYFSPSGFFGYLYWYSLYFVHKYIFDMMIDNIIREARKS